MPESLTNALLSILNLVAITYGLYVLKQKTQATQNDVAMRLIQDKVNKYDALEKTQELLKAEFENYKKRLDEQILNNLAMSRTIEDQARKITQLTVDLQSLTTDHELLKNEKRVLEDNNRLLSQDMAKTQVERDLAVAKYNVLDNALGRIHVNISNVEIKPNES